MSTVEEIEARRAARKAELQEKRDAQYVIDLQRLDELEIEHGDSNIGRVDMTHYDPGLPTMVLCRTPTEMEMKRYTDRLKERKGKKGDASEAARELAVTCRVYPEADAFKEMEGARPGIRVQLGVQAAELAVGRSVDDAKN